MRLALAAADQAAERGEVPVGAVVLGPDAKVLAVAGNEREATADVSAHAEIVALRRASELLGGGWRLPDCTLIVTLEPCVMCAGAIVAARLERVVFAAFDPKAGAATSVWDLLRDPRLLHRPQVVSGILADQAESQLKAFFGPRREQ